MIYKKNHVFKGTLQFLLLFSVSMIQAFGVKVLLQKISITDLQESKIDIISPHGFILSSHPCLALGHEYPGKMITVSARSGMVTLNFNSLPEKLVYLHPALSKAQIIALKSQISCWLESSLPELKNESKKCHSLFDLIVTLETPIPAQAYEVLNEYIAEIFEFFLSDFLTIIDGQPVCSLQTLLSYRDDFLDNRVKNLFLESIASCQLSKPERKKIEKNQEARYDFFFNQLQIVLQKLLYEFVPMLPKRLLQQIVKEDLGTIAFQGNNYLGSFLLFQEKKQLCIINSLDIDDYLLSVIKHEGWPGWPLEMNKVLAVVCRTYLIWQVLQAQKAARPYHIENGIKHQTYKGHHNSIKLKQAVDQTKDMFVSYDEKPALTMYDACCGGIVPANIDDPGHKNISYLARTYPCTFCKNFKIFNWHVELSEQDIVKRLQKDFAKVTKIVDFSVQKKDRAGLVKKVLINVGPRKISITQKKMKSLFPELKSSCFDITKHSGKKFTITGRGYGHHKGLCQWGACKLVKDDNWNFEQVLQFYYPGTKLMKLTYQR